MPQTHIDLFQLPHKDLAPQHHEDQLSYKTRGWNEMKNVN